MLFISNQNVQVVVIVAVAVLLLLLLVVVVVLLVVVCDTPLSAKVGSNFAGKWRALGRYN
jgi:hypothetical protein